MAFPSQLGTDEDSQVLAELVSNLTEVGGPPADEVAPRTAEVGPTLPRRGNFREERFHLRPLNASELTRRCNHGGLAHPPGELGKETVQAVVQHRGGVPESFGSEHHLEAE